VEWVHTIIHVGNLAIYHTARTNGLRYLVLTRPCGLAFYDVSVRRPAVLRSGLTTMDGGNAGFAGAKTCPSDISSRICPCRRLVVVFHFGILTIMDIRFSYRGLAPHKFMPMLGVHKTPQPTPKSGAAGLYRCVPGMDVT